MGDMPKFPRLFACWYVTTRWVLPVLLIVALSFPLIALAAPTLLFVGLGTLASGLSYYLDFGPVYRWRFAKAWAEGERDGHRLNNIGATGHAERSGSQ